MGLCERCKKAQATFHLTDLQPSGEKQERHLCERCATEEGLLQPQKVASFAEYLENFVGGAKESAAALSHLVCEECGISYVEFRNQGMLGCAKDYDVFKEPLAKLISRAQDGATHHVGKSPKRLGVRRSSQQDISRLKRQLDESVSAEDYERAAELRDRIRKLEAS
ncbi:MAG: UvrB/UvrC motif-containing protein [Phycisphaerae bacterium]